MKKLAGGAIAAVLVLVGLMALALTAVGAASEPANANTCATPLQKADPPSVAPGATPPADTEVLNAHPVVVPLAPQGPQKNPKWDAEQTRNASTITNVARTRGLPPRAAVIAVATAMQESSLRNLHSGDGDSLGLFQQRPSQGWGTPAEINDPVHASNAFYDRLVKVHNWQTEPLTQAAQAVQGSGFATAYAPWEQSAAGLVSNTWGSAAVTSTYQCDTTAPAQDTNASFTDLHNPRTSSQAIQAIRAAAGRTGFSRMCDNLVAQAYGWGSSGSDTANIHWSRLVTAGKAHPGNAAPPAGALLFYANSDQYGHVALYLGNDLVASNDIEDTYKGEGKIAIVHRSELTHGKWNLSYRGWAEPDFPSASGKSTIPLANGTSQP